MNTRRSLLKTGLALPLMPALKAGSSEPGLEGDMGNRKKIIDHFMWAAVDLESASAEFERLTGVRPVFGGRHPGFGTHNALVSLGNGSYMEVLALDPSQSVSNPIVEEIKQMQSPGILAFHVQRADLEGVAGVLEEMNVKYNGPLELGRERPDGLSLRWRLLFPESPVFRHALPVFIDWMDAPHPSATAPAGCELAHFEVGHPRHAELTMLYKKLNVGVPVVKSEDAYARATLVTPKGEVILQGRL